MVPDPDQVLRLLPKDADGNYNDADLDRMHDLFYCFPSCGCSNSRKRWPRGDYSVDLMNRFDREKWEKRNPPPKPPPRPTPPMFEPPWWSWWTT